MKLQEILTEMNRRDFLKGAGAAAVTGMAGRAGAQERNSLNGVIVMIAEGVKPKNRKWSHKGAEDIVYFLKSSNVSATLAPPNASTQQHLKALAGPDAVSVIKVAMKFGYMESFKAECYSLDGNLLWKEKASGSWGHSKESIADGLVARMSEKIQKHIGKEGLPTSKASWE